MSNEDQPRPGRWTRRLWTGALGAFLGALLGLIAATLMDASAIDGALYGSVAGFAVGFVLGLGGVEFVMGLFHSAS